MKLYQHGKVISTGKTYIIFETNQAGVIVHVNYPENFKVLQKIKIFIYEYRTEYLKAIFGFRTFKERLLFEDLLGVSGIGPKTAMALLKMGYQKLIIAIIERNVKQITTIKSIGPNTAQQLIIELRSKYLKMQNIKLPNLQKDAIEDTLRSLGFSISQIKFALAKLKPTTNMELAVEKAIQIIAHEYQPSSPKL